MPIDRGVIDQQLQALGESRGWWERRELRDLPSVLDADERILAISRGKVARLRWFRHTWLIVVTERRLLCLRSAGTSWRQLEVDADQITRVALRIGPFRGRVLAVARGRTYRLLVPRADSYKVSSALTTLSNPSGKTKSGVRPTIMVRRVIEHVLALPAAALNPVGPRSAPPELAASLATDERIHALEDEIDELRRQVRFLEELLHSKQVGSATKKLPPS